MRRRRLFLTLVAVALLAVAGGVAWTVFRPRPRFTLEQLDRVQVGMTAEEVVTVLGCPPGNYTDDIYTSIYGDYGFDFDDAAGLTSPGRLKRWQVEWRPAPTDSDGRQRREALAIQVSLDERGKVARLRTASVTYLVPSVADRFSWWLAGVRAKLGL